MTSNELLEFIVEMQAEKKETNLYPTHVLRMELCEMLGFPLVDELTNELIEQGKIRLGDTINDKYYKII